MDIRVRPHRFGVVPLMRPHFAACLALLLSLGAAPSLPAQSTSPRDELLRFVPADFGLCLAVQDLRGHVEKWQASPWFKALQSSRIGQTVLKAPEIEQLQKFQ